MRAREMMNVFFVAIDGGVSVQRAAQAMRDEAVGIVCVCGEDKVPQGVLTDRDITTRVAAAGVAPDSVEVRKVMTADPVTCREDDEVSKIEELMRQRRIGRVLVVDDEGKMVGVVSLAEVWHYESPLSAGLVSRQVTERELRVQR